MMNNSHIIFFALALLLSRALVIWGLNYIQNRICVSNSLIYDIPIKTKQLDRERYAPFWGTAIDSGVFIVLVKMKILIFHSISFSEVGVLLAAHIFLVEPIYYVYHRLLHTRWFYRRYHVHHHLSTVPTTNTSFTFLLMERLSYTLLFAFPIFAADFFGLLSLYGLFGYLIIFDIVNAIGHFNHEFFPEKYRKSIGWYLFYTPTYHSQHHSKFRKNYALFMPVFDYLFKTYESYTGDIFLQVKHNQPLKHISEVPLNAKKRRP